MRAVRWALLYVGGVVGLLAVGGALGALVNYLMYGSAMPGVH